MAHLASAASRSPRHAPARPRRVEDPDVESKLRRITASVLDELKNPYAIPSVVIAAALRKARDI